MNNDLPNVKDMTISELCALDPVSASEYLHTRFEAVLQFILSDAQPLGKITDYFYRVEYQSRGTPHWHCIFWVENAPEIGESSDPEMILKFITQNIICKLPEKEKDP